MKPLYTKTKAEDQGFINRGWFSESEILAVAKQTIACVYAFAYNPTRPSTNDFPHDFESTQYIGKSAGKYYFDQKSPNGKGQIKSTMVTRWHDHGKNIRRARRGESTNPKYITLAEYEALHPDCTLWINILSPDPNGTEEDLKRLPSKAIAIESDAILDFSTCWGDAPPMNRSQCEKINRRKPGSKSDKYMATVVSLHFTDYE